MEGHPELWSEPQVLGNLENIQHRAVYRYRDNTTSELALTHPSLDPDGISDLIEVRLRSIKSECEANINFHNITDIRVRALWIDFIGNEVAYSIIEPGEKKRYRTYASHPWIVRDIQTHRRLVLNNGEVVFGEVGPMQEVSIRSPPTLIWNEEAHELFPLAFQEQVRCLLMCHHRLERGSPYDLLLNLAEKSIEGSSNEGCLIEMTVPTREKRLSHPPAGTAMRSLTLGDIPELLLKKVVFYMARAFSMKQTLLEGWDAAPDLMPVTLPGDIPLSAFSPKITIHEMFGNDEDFEDDEDMTDSEIMDDDMTNSDIINDDLSDDEDAFHEGAVH